MFTTPADGESGPCAVRPSTLGGLKEEAQKRQSSNSMSISREAPDGFKGQEEWAHNT